MAAGTCKISNSLNFNLKIGSLIEVTTVAAFRTWLASNNVQLLYKLATPVTVQLTAQQIETLIGENNVWSDANGTLNIKYLKTAQ